MQMSRRMSGVARGFKKPNSHRINIQFYPESSPIQIHSDSRRTDLALSLLYQVPVCILSSRKKKNKVERSWHRFQFYAKYSFSLVITHKRVKRSLPPPSVFGSWHHIQYTYRFLNTESSFRKCVFKLIRALARGITPTLALWHVIICVAGPRLYAAQAATTSAVIVRETKFCDFRCAPSHHLRESIVWFALL